MGLLEKFARKDHVYDVVVVGLGAAGVGVSVTLRHAGIDNFVALDRHGVGASFERWPEEMRVITPSFPTNSVGMLDINSVAIGASPAFGLQVEHPTGKQYASHLNGVASYYELPMKVGIDVKRIILAGDRLHVETDGKTFITKNVIWAAGDFQYPKIGDLTGSEKCLHTATLTSYGALEGDEFTIIGGYESGIDAAYNLARLGKRVRLFDRECPWELQTSDPSVGLSTYSLERMRTSEFEQNVQLFANTQIESVMVNDGTYELAAFDGKRYKSATQPLLALGFEGGHTLVSHLFEKRGDGFPFLSEQDESTLVPGLFLCGPAVRHEGQIFCFIYKYRQRFAVVAKTIATSLGLPAEGLEMYRNWGMYLDDLSCCGEECVC